MVVIYGSEYGSAKRYAEELAKRINAETISFKDVESIEGHNTVIYIGSLYAGGVLGLKNTVKKFDLSTKKLFIATVGLADPKDRKTVRYAIRKDTRFDVAALRRNVSLLPAGYELRAIDAALYHQCLADPMTRDFVSVFRDEETYLRDGRGVVILKDGRIVSGASSYSRYREGIEIEVDTLPQERRKHLALINCSALIVRCLEEGLYPSWDAQNKESVHLAEKLGYMLDHSHTVYEVEKQ